MADERRVFAESLSASLSDARALTNQLFRKQGARLPPDTVSAFNVIVHSARNIYKPALTFEAPTVIIRLGRITRRSPRGSSWGADPIFDFHTMLPYTGCESHFIFEVRNGSDVVGCSILPLEHVFQEGYVKKSLPLLRNGRVWKGSPIGSGVLQDADTTGPRELLVTVLCSTEEHASSDKLDLATTLRATCSQLRVTIHRFEMRDLAPEEPPLKRPFVKVALGAESRCTMPAYVEAPQPGDEYVFNCSDREELTSWVWFFQSMRQHYVPKPVPAPKGSQAVEAYRKEVRDGLRVEYLNAQFLFWHQQQSCINFEIYDQDFLGFETFKASANISLTQLFQEPFREGSALERSTALSSETVKIGPLRESLRAWGVRTASGSPVAGFVEFELEFIMDPLALPLRGERMSRLTLTRNNERTARHTNVLKAVSSSSRLVDTGGRYQSITSLPVSVRASLAKAVGIAAIVNARKTFLHEADVSRGRAQLVATIKTLIDACAAGDVTLEFFQPVSDQATQPLSLQAAASELQGACASQGVPALVPIVCLVAEMMRQKGRQGYKASARSAALLLASRVQDSVCGSDGATFVELLERFLLLSSISAYNSGLDLLPLHKDCLSCAELVDDARDLLPHELTFPQNTRSEQKAKALTVATGFFPDIDLARLGMVVTGAKDCSASYPKELLAGKAALVYTAVITSAVLGAALGAGTAIMQAYIIRMFGSRQFCFGACQSLYKGGVIDFLVTPLESKEVIGLLALSYSSFYGWDVFTRLNLRYAQLREVSIDCLSPWTSPHLVICASGFLLDSSDIYAPWEADPERPWTIGRIAAVRYDTEELMMQGGRLASVIKRRLTTLKNTVSFVYSTVNPVNLLANILQLVHNEIDDSFDITISRATQAGVRLAAMLLESAARGNCAPVSFYGYSSGAVLIHSCLCELRRIADTQGGSTAILVEELVHDVVLLGAPISSDNIDQWRSLRLLAHGRFVNGFYRMDIDLMWYARRRSDNFIGYKELIRVEGVENIALDDFLSSHSDYPSQIPLILSYISGG